MTAFFKKNIQPQARVGERLQQLREEKNISVVELAQKTKLQESSIRALETSAFHHLPKELLYQKMFIKRYALGLEIDPEPYISQFLQEEVSEKKEPLSLLKKPSWLKRKPTVFSLVSGATVFLFFSLYVGLHLHTMYKPPLLQLTDPTDEQINETGHATIAGITDPEVSVFINGEQVRSGNTGKFNTTVDLQPGVNTILVSAKKRHGTESNITKYVLYRETSQVSYTGNEQLTTN